MLTMFLKTQSGPQYLTIIIDVLEREFLICDVAGGLFRKPPEFTKGNPHL